MTDVEKKIKASETIAFEYTVEQILPTEWTATHTEGEFDRWDITATNGKETVYIETKMRDITAESVEEEGCLVNYDKVEYLANTGQKAAIIQYFPLSNKCYVWNVKEKDQWPKRKIHKSKNNYSEEKIWDTVYYMPMDSYHQRKVDLTDYEERWERIMTEINTKYE